VATNLKFEMQRMLKSGRRWKLRFDLNNDRLNSGSFSPTCALVRLDPVLFRRRIVGGLLRLRLLLPSGVAVADLAAESIASAGFH
jgi:hypothetical protein